MYLNLCANGKHMNQQFLSGKLKVWLDENIKKESLSFHSTFISVDVGPLAGI